MPKKKTYRNPNGYGSITKLSGNRRRPYMVKVNTRIDDRGYPVCDILGYYETRPEALIALGQYNNSPYDVNTKKITFSQLYKKWFTKKYEGVKKYSQSSVTCTRNAFAKSSVLHDLPFVAIRTAHMQDILDNSNLSHAYAEHVQNLFTQMYKYALEYDIADKDYSKFLKLTMSEDDQPGVPFTKQEIGELWKNKDKPFVDTILIFIYSGWRVSELLNMPRDKINIIDKTFEGGVKTQAGKNRIVPIHTKIFKMVQSRYDEGYSSLIGKNGKAITNKNSYYKLFSEALLACGIVTIHTPHDCRHTFVTLLDNAGANQTAIDRLVGHASKTLTAKTYTHKDIEQLRQNIELI